MSSLLISSPGWGKSFLAKCLARYFDMEYLEFSVAQMSTNRDMIDCLASIASVQTRTEKRTLVFMDELNAEIEGHNVMGLLLGPLWDGMFVLDGKVYRIAPSAWVFASTQDLEALRGRDKGSDFISRLNGPIVELTPPLDPITRKPDHMSRQIQRTEQVYIMVSLLSNQWGPISEVQEAVIRLFHELEPVNGFRSLEFFARNFSGVRRGCVVASNVPDLSGDDKLQRHIGVPSKWENIRERPRDDEGEFVKIETIIR